MRFSSHRTDLVKCVATSLAGGDPVRLNLKIQGKTMESSREDMASIIAATWLILVSEDGLFLDIIPATQVEKKYNFESPYMSNV